MLYGLLLDRFAPGWRERVLGGQSLSDLATEAVSGSEPADADPVARRHIEASEQRRDADRAQRNRRWVQLLVDGPTLRLPISQLQTVFDPNSLVALKGHGTVYPSVKLTDRWGHIDVVDWGALVDPDWKWISLAARGMETAGTQVTGRGWRLKLNPGWTVRTTGSGHQAVEG